MPATSTRHREQNVGFGQEQQRAVLVIFRSSGQPRDELRWAVEESEALAREVDLHVVCELAQTRRQSCHALLSADALGQLRELVETSSLDSSRLTLLMDTVLTPRQRQELSALPFTLLDRTDLILRLFAKRARTREAQLTVQIAQLRHELPQLRDDRSKAGREGGGGRGERGNTQTALAKERQRERLTALERALARVQRMTQVQRARRAELKRVAIVGYTNAGKSSWLTALTGKLTLIADKPFATLGTTVRAVSEEAREPLLLCDTVGFVRDLPHALVPSFAATLEEVRDASRLLVVLNAAHPAFEEQLAVVEKMLTQLGAERLPRLVLLNKIDCLDVTSRAALARRLPEALQVSSRRAEDVARVKELLLARG